MPIRKEWRHFYKTASYQAAKQRCMERARWRCEECGLRHGTRGWRAAGVFHPAAGPHWKRRAGRYKVVLIQLGAAHLNHTPGDDRDENLRALCRRCHLLNDAPHHRDTRAARKDRDRPLLQQIDAELAKLRTFMSAARKHGFGGIVGTA